MNPTDIAALTVFVIGWLLYQPTLKRLSRGRGVINTDMTVVRRRWMANMAGRENRFLDSQLMGHALNSASFFASANLIVIAAAAGALSRSDSTYQTVARMAVTETGPRWLFQAKLALVILALARGLLDFIKKCVVSFGYPSSVFGTHSLRIGGASQLAMMGFTEAQIKAAGRGLSDCYLQYVM